MLQRAATDAGASWISMDELQERIGYALPLRSSDAPFIRHAAIDAAQLQSLLAAHDGTDSSSLPSSQATAPLGATVAAAAPAAESGEGSSNLGSSLRCLHFSRYEVETEWNASVAAEERVANQNQQATAANAATPAASAPAKFNDRLLSDRLLNWCLALKPQPGLQAERAKLQATFDADRRSAATASIRQPLHFAQSAPFPGATTASDVTPALPATPSRADGLGLPSSAPSTAKTKSFSPGGASVANALLNLGPTAPTPTTPVTNRAAAAAAPVSSAAAATLSTKSLNPLHSLARTASSSSSSLLPSAAATAAASSAVSPSSSIASRALLGIGAVAAVPPPEPAKSKRGAVAGGASLHPPEKKARVETSTHSPPKPRGSRKTTDAAAAAAASSQSASILQLAALAEQQTV